MKKAGRDFSARWTSFCGQTTTFGLGTSNSVRKKWLDLAKVNVEKAKLRWKSKIFAGKLIVYCLLQQIFMDVIFNPENVGE